MKRKTYTVRLTTRRANQYVAYTGTSRDKAAEVANMMRLTLCYGKGTGEITLLEDGTPDVCYSVKNGEGFLSLIGGAAKQPAGDGHTWADVTALNNEMLAHAIKTAGERKGGAK